MNDWTLTDLLEAYARARSDHTRADFAVRHAVVKREKAEAEGSMSAVRSEIERHCDAQ